MDSSLDTPCRCEVSVFLQAVLLLSRDKRWAGSRMVGPDIGKIFRSGQENIFVRNYYLHITFLLPFCEISKSCEFGGVLHPLNNLGEKNQEHLYLGTNVLEVCVLR